MSPPKRSGAFAKLDKHHHEERDLGEENDQPSGDTARVLEAIALCQVKVDISLIRQDIHKFHEQVSETERGGRPASTPGHH